MRAVTNFSFANKIAVGNGFSRLYSEDHASALHVLNCPIKYKLSIYKDKFSFYKPQSVSKNQQAILMPDLDKTGS
jgi:hypothetical protein